MRVFERTDDRKIVADQIIVARIDGRGFTKLTKDTHPFEAPFDEKFRDLMVATTRHLAGCGGRVIYGYTQSDEISLLFHPADGWFGRKVRKLNSVLAGEASACFSVNFGHMAVFDCRVIPLPSEAEVVDYFRWRAEDAHRNCLNAHCYWTLRNKGSSVSQATEAIRHLTAAVKVDLLRNESGVEFDRLPLWQRRGVGLYEVAREKAAVNPLTGEAVVATRYSVEADFELPAREDYSAFISGLLRRQTVAG